jgi:hypothetical protein
MQLSSTWQHPLHAYPPHVQLPAVHRSSGSHMPHASPPLPHSFVDWEENGTHFPSALQQPLWHDVASQAH